MRNPLKLIHRNGNTLRLRSIEISVKSGVLLALSLDKFSDPAHWSLHFAVLGLSVYITLPFPVRKETEDILDRWGFSIYREEAMHLEWGPKRKKILWYPWKRQRRNEWHRGVDGAWFIREKTGYKTPHPWTPWYEDPKVLLQKLEYRYVLDSGEVQVRTATIAETRSEWAWGCLRKTKINWPWPLMKVSRYIEVHFSDEVGERSGSWKGGCIGCGYQVLDGETPEQALRRMERERKF